MRFSIWMLVLLALMPAFILFAGLSVAGGLRMPAEWIVMAAFGCATIFIGREAACGLGEASH